MNQLQLNRHHAVRAIVTAIATVTAITQIAAMDARVTILSEVLESHISKSAEVKVKKATNVMFVHIQANLSALPITHVTNATCAQNPETTRRNHG